MPLLSLLIAALWLAAMLVTSPACAQTADDRAKLDKAIDQLVAESAGITHLDHTNVKPQLTRPHPLIADFNAPVFGPLILQRLTAGKLSGDPYGDAYVRWHLLPVIADALEARFEQWKKTGQIKPQPDDARAILAMLQALPDDPDLDWHKEEWQEPKDIADKVTELKKSTRMRIGVPPFDRYVYEEDALEHATGQRKAEIEQTIKQIALLRAKLKKVKDPVAHEFNERLRKLRQLLRQSRGELLYALIQTGDRSALRLIASEIDKQIRTHQQFGILLTQYLYVAMYDGYLLMYDPADLANLRHNLMQTASANDQSLVYMDGDEPPPPWMRPRHHNFADLAFHLIQVLDDPASLSKYHDALAPVPARPLPPRPQGAATADNLTTARLRYAIDLALNQIYQPSDDNQDLLPHYRLRDQSKLYVVMRYGVNTPAFQAVVHEPGNQALLCWAMLRAGESFQNPHFYRRMSFVLAAETPYTFDRAMRLEMLSNLSPQQWQPWFKRDADWLFNAYEADKASGTLTDEYGREKGPSDKFSNAQAQYGTLGLWAIEKSGRDIPPKLWRIVDTYWRAQQHAPSTSGDAGWSVGLIEGDHKLKSNASNRLALQPQGPMTAAGVMALSLSERALYADNLTNTAAAAKVPNLDAGLHWLDQHFSLDDHPEGANWYHYLWTIQQLAHANGLRKLHGIDLFRDVTADILNAQRPDGTWEDLSLTDASQRRQSRPISTAFALLYLTDAVASNVTISKLQFPGHWNNRPHDLWNFTDFASARYENNSLWQIVDLDMPVEFLLESPLLYLSTDQPVTLPDAQVKTLRAYLDAGGMLLLNGENTSAALIRCFNDLCAKLYPDLPLTDVPDDHPFYNLHRPVSTQLPLRMVSNGLRPLIVLFQRDLGRDLQTTSSASASAPSPQRPAAGPSASTSSTSGGDAYNLLGNIYLFAVGMDTQRLRLDLGRLMRNSKPTTTSARIVRLFASPEPAADDQLKIYMANEHHLDLTIDQIAPAQLTPDVHLALLSIAPSQTLSTADAATIHHWCASGGTLLLDAAGGSPAAIEAADAAVAQIFPHMRLIPLPFNSPILTGQNIPAGHDNTNVRYRSHLLRQLGPTSTPRLQALRLDGRIILIDSPEDLTASVAGLPHWSILGYTPTSARQLLANTILTTTR